MVANQNLACDIDARLRKLSWEDIKKPFIDFDEVEKLTEKIVLNLVYSKNRKFLV